MTISTNDQLGGYVNKGGQNPHESQITERPESPKSMLHETETMSTIELDLSTDEILFLALEAHKRDITLNAFIVEILKDFIANYSDQPTRGTI